MKEKFADIWDKIKDFAEDHGEMIIYAFYGAFMIAVTVISWRSLSLFNKKTKLEIARLSK